MENGKREPTLALDWRLAAALDVPFAALMAEYVASGTVITRKDRAKIIVSADPGLASRALFLFDEEAGVVWRANARDASLRARRSSK
jgi:transcriptional regulator with XRE-family HTH domain